MKVHKNIVLFGCFITFCVITLFTAFSHEIWYDEAEAWAIARDNAIPELWNVLKSEGHPFLWYFILKIFITLGFSAEIMSFISWTFTVITALLICFKSPFEKKMKVVVIFSSGFIYFNSVISRIYCLIPLLLVLIAVVFPKRNQYPVLYGILIALLTNTHVCICGVVAVLGINMIVELIRSWKSDTKYDKFKKIAGLSISGCGVILFLSIMLYSLSSNSEVSSGNKTVLDMIYGAVLTLYDVPVLASLPSEVSVLSSLLCIFYSAVLFLLFYLFRRFRLSFWILAVFLFFYSIICGAVWCTIPNRAAVVYFVILFSYWISTEVKPVPEDKKSTNLSENKVDTKFVKFILKKLEMADKTAVKTAGNSILILFLLSVPVGFYYAISDLYKDFSPEKKAAEYIKEHYNNKSAVIVTPFDTIPELSCYIPEYTKYSVYLNKEYTYHDHTLKLEDVINSYDSDGVNQYLEQWDKLIYVFASSDDKDVIESGAYKIPGNIVYKVYDCIKFETKNVNLVISEVTVDDVLEYYK